MCDISMHISRYSKWTSNRLKNQLPFDTKWILRLYNRHSIIHRILSRTVQCKSRNREFKAEIVTGSDDSKIAVMARTNKYQLPVILGSVNQSGAQPCNFVGRDVEMMGARGSEVVKHVFLLCSRWLRENLLLILRNRGNNKIRLRSHVNFFLNLITKNNFLIETWNLGTWH